MNFEEFYPLFCEDNGIAVGGQYSEEIEDYCLLSFQAGAASRDTEIHHLQMALADTEALELGTAEKCDKLREQVAMLREAFQTFIDEHEECSDADDWLAMMCSCEAYHVANEALAASEPKITKPT